MKINEKDFFGFLYKTNNAPKDKNLLNEFYSMIGELISQSEHKYNLDNIKKITVNDISNLMIKTYYDSFFFTKTSLNLCNKIKLPDLKNIEYLNNIENQQSQYVIDKATFIIFEKNDKSIFGYYVKEFKEYL